MEEEAGKGFNSSYIASDSAHKLVKLIYGFPEVIVEAGEKYEPSIVTRHIVDIAQAFNKFYHNTRSSVVDDPEERKAKVALVIAARDTIKNGLGLLGIKAPERM